VKQGKPASRGPTEPWFQRRPRLAVLVSSLLFAAVLALRLTLGDATDAISMLYALPITLLAVARGFRVGLLAGCLGVALTGIGVAAGGLELSWIGWTCRCIPLLLMGGLLGDASDRLRRAEAERRVSAVAAMRHRQAIEVNDRLVQGMAAAKWSLEAGRVTSGIDTLAETLSEGHQLVSALLRDADMGVDGHRGSSPQGYP
jgi:glucose-6-phosphate-specific signal transduction histidine kinase